MDKQQTERDTINLVRATIKVSSALNNLKELVFFKKYIRFGLKKETDAWRLMVSTHMQPLMDGIIDQEDKLIASIYSSFDSVDDSILTDEENLDKRQLILFYAKLISAINDLSYMSSSDLNIYPIIINDFTAKVIKQIDKQYPFVKNIKDENESTINDLIAYIDKCGFNILKYELPVKENSVD